MDYYEEFYIRGFERIRKGKKGAVYMRYADERQGARKPEIEETPLNYGGADTENYVITVPKRKMNACVIVIRTSKSTYQAMACDEGRVERFSETSVESLRKAVTAFFERVSKAS